MKTKKRNKKYNAMKGAIKSAKVGLRNLGVWHSQRTKSEYTAEVVNYKTLKSEDVGRSIWTLPSSMVSLHLPQSGRPTPTPAFFMAQAIPA